MWNCNEKIISFLITALMLAPTLFNFIPCGSGSGKDVHVFYYAYNDVYISTVRSALDKLLNDSGVSYQDYDGNSDQTSQTKQIQTAIAKGAKLIVVNFVNTASDDDANAIITLAKNADIPVIFFNREISDAVVNSYDKCAFVGTDAAEAGHMQGDMIGNYIVKNFDKIDLNGDGTISYILFKGEEGNNEATCRTQYAVEDADKLLTGNGMKKLEFYDSSNTNKYLVDKNGTWSAASAFDYMTAALSSYNDSNGNMIELVICNNDNMAEGAISALNNAGYNTGSEKSIPVFGVDATSEAKTLIDDGKMTGTIEQDSDGMSAAIKLLIDNVLDGKAIMDGTDDYNVDANTAKIRIPYGVYVIK